MRPPAIPLIDALGLVAAAQGLLLILAALVVGRKVRRDRKERASLRRRAEFAAAISDGGIVNLRRVARACSRDQAALEDLLYVLDFAEPLPARNRAALLEAARAVGLLRALLRSLEAHRSTARGVAALALSKLRLPGGEARVARLIGDPDADVRLAACSALASWATPAAATALIDALDQFDLPAARIVEKLGSWAAPTVHAALRAAIDGDRAGQLSPQRRQNRVHLIRALELCGFEEAEPEVLELLDSDDLEEQIGAARALGRLGSRQSIEPLIASLESDSWPLRAQAARALGLLAAVEAMPNLAAHLCDPAWWVRKQAGRALVALGPAGGFQLLQEAMAHEDRFARDRAAEELRLAVVSHQQLEPMVLARVAGGGLGREATSIGPAG